MLPYQLIDPENQLKIARQHADQLRADWRSANAHDDRPCRQSAVANIRESAGRAFVGLGRRLLSARSRPRRPARSIGRAGSGC